MNGTFLNIPLSAVPSWALDISPPPAPVPWTPDLMSTFRGGWRPDDLTGLSAGAAIATLPSFGGVVTNTLTQATGSLQPVIGTINGKKTALFDGTDDYMLASDLTVANAATSLFFWVLVQFVAYPADSQYKFITFDEGTSTGRRFGILLGNTTTAKKIGITYRIPDTGSTTVRLSTTAIAIGTPQLICAEMIVGGTGAPRTRLWLNGTVILDEVPGVSTAPALVNPVFDATNATKSTMGGSYSGTTAQSNAHFILMGRNRGAVSDTDRQKLEGYACWYAGIQAQLPAGHPYLSAAPVLP
ncbi:MAG: hypothetical protein JWM59_1546 [Verrucomicrobiales bacterium]|nr:hypothetical protein [Verrucomicrobiales bacterium]